MTSISFPSHSRLQIQRWICKRMRCDELESRLCSSLDDDTVLFHSFLSHRFRWGRCIQWMSFIIMPPKQKSVSRLFVCGRGSCHSSSSVRHEVGNRSTRSYSLSDFMSDFHPMSLIYIHICVAHNHYSLFIVIANVYLLVAHFIIICVMNGDGIRRFSLSRNYVMHASSAVSNQRIRRAKRNTEQEAPATQFE